LNSSKYKYLHPEGRRQFVVLVYVLFASSLQSLLTLGERFPDSHLGQFYTFSSCLAARVAVPRLNPVAAAGGTAAPVAGGGWRRESLSGIPLAIWRLAHALCFRAGEIKANCAIVCGMESPAVVRTLVHKADERNFLLRESRAWVCRLVAEATGQTVGVQLKVMFGPFGVSREYFTCDDGGRFRHVASSLQLNLCLNIELNASEDNPETVNTLRQVLATWRAASGHSARRAIVRDACIGLKELLNSLSQTPTLSHLQDVGSIYFRSQSAPDNELQQVEDELTGLLRRLRAIDAADGEKIISPARFEQFLNSPIL
jgi:hypothetical protein